jgi:Holliday junction resolvase RusA-like endonuclease
MDYKIDLENERNYAEMFNQLNNSKQAELGVISRMCRKGINWKSVTFTIPTAPVPSHRPRLSNNRIYVPGAAKNATFFQRHVLPTLDGLMISTPCKVDLRLYIKTPSSFSKIQTCLAEIGLLRPWGRNGDVDNFEKSIYDQIQPNEKRGHRGILADDSLIIENHTQKFYSVNPRSEVTITWMDSIPQKLLHILRLDK